MNIDQVKKDIRTVPDFPKPGIMFKDITTILQSPEHFTTIIDEMYEKYKELGITKVVCVESRGFIVGGALAYKLGAGFVPVRKPNKLPSDTFKEEYELEYGTDTLEIHKDALSEDDIILIHDDLLATGGTMTASIRLVGRFNVHKIYSSFLIELDFLEGRKKIESQSEVTSLINF